MFFCNKEEAKTSYSHKLFSIPSFLSEIYYPVKLVNSKYSISFLKTVRCLSIFKAHTSTKEKRRKHFVKDDGACLV
jgi:hypothetical protein